MYTVWGELSTLVVIFLMFLCTVEKYQKHTIFSLQNAYGNINEQAKFIDTDSKLYQFTSILFQFALLSELTIASIFWGYLYGIRTDWSMLNKKELSNKLYYDVVLDVENHNHVVPITLILFEYFLNNIKIEPGHLFISVGITFVYMIIHYLYVMYY